MQAERQRQAASELQGGLRVDMRVPSSSSPEVRSNSPSNGTRWIEAVDEQTGHVYEYNTLTKETRWKVEDGSPGPALSNGASHEPEARHGISKSLQDPQMHAPHHAPPVRQTLAARGFGGGGGVAEIGDAAPSPAATAGGSIDGSFDSGSMGGASNGSMGGASNGAPAAALRTSIDELLAREEDGDSAHCEGGDASVAELFQRMRLFDAQHGGGLRLLQEYLRGGGEAVEGPRQLSPLYNQRISSLGRYRSGIEFIVHQLGHQTEEPRTGPAAAANKPRAQEWALRNLWRMFAEGSNEGQQEQRRWFVECGGGCSLRR
jgi:hypothetical protein